MARFLDANGRTWRAQDVERDAGMVEAVAASAADHAAIGAWIDERIS